LKSSRRIFFDVTFTRSQVGNVGITRTVRALLGRVAAKAGEVGDCQPIVFHSRGFRVERASGSVASQGAAPSQTTAARLFRWVMGGSFRRAVTRALPLPVLSAGWALYNRATFDAMSRHAAPVRFTEHDVLFLCDAWWNYPVAKPCAAARRQGARVVAMVHDLIPLRHPEYCAPLFTQTFTRWLREVIANSDAVICNSAATMRDLEAYAASADLKLPPTGHFRLGCDLLALPRHGQVRPELVGFTAGGDPCFSAVGSIEPRKNYAFLLSVFEGLWAEGSSARLIIVGRPTADCSELVERMKAHPEFGKRFLPIFDASDEELEHVYRASRALVFPSLAEGFGLPLVEARTRGLVVIASDIPVFQELADAGVQIFSRHSADALRRCVIDQLKSDRASAVAPMPAFTWDESARQFLEVSERLLQGRPA